MGQAMPRRQVLIVSEDDEARHLAGALFEESDLLPVECGAVDDALDHLRRDAGRVAALFVDVDDVGDRAGALIDAARRACPSIRVIATGEGRAPAPMRDARFMAKPWLPLDLLIAAESTMREGERDRR